MGAAQGFYRKLISGLRSLGLAHPGLLSAAALPLVERTYQIECRITSFLPPIRSHSDR